MSSHVHTATVLAVTSGKGGVGKKAVRDAVIVPRAVVDHLPHAAASRCFRILASRLAGLGRGPGGLRLAVGASLAEGPTEVSRCA